MLVELVAITKPLKKALNTEEFIEYCGRVCTNTTDKTGNDSARFVKSRINQHHYSILEHCTASFEISGISRSCLAQLTRHRHASYSVMSQRYCSMSGQSIIVPESIANDKIANQIFKDVELTARWAYNSLIEFGIPNQDARFCLPIGTETRLVMTANFRTWREIIEKRCHNSAQWEIREMCTRILELLYEQSPSVFEDLKVRFVGENPKNNINN